MRCNGPLGTLVQPVDRAHLRLGQLEIVNIGILRLVRIGFRQRGEPVQTRKQFDMEASESERVRLFSEGFQVLDDSPFLETPPDQHLGDALARLLGDLLKYGFVRPRIPHQGAVGLHDDACDMKTFESYGPASESKNMLVVIAVRLGSQEERKDARRTLFTAIIDHLPLLAERMELGLVDSGFLALEGLEVLDAAVFGVERRLCCVSSRNHVSQEG